MKELENFIIKEIDGKFNYEHDQSIYLEFEFNGLLYLINCTMEIEYIEFKNIQDEYGNYEWMSDVIRQGITFDNIACYYNDKQVNDNIDTKYITEHFKI